MYLIMFYIKMLKFNIKLYYHSMNLFKKNLSYFYYKNLSYVHY